MNIKSKIARLPKSVRNQLGQRIEDGCPGSSIVIWLNELPEVKAILIEHFHGSAVSEQNLSDWKQSGHQDWLRRQEAQSAALQLLATAEDLDLNDTRQQRSLLDSFAGLLAIEMSRLAMTLLQNEADPGKKWKLLCQINKELSQLRRAHDRTVRTAVIEDKRNAEAGRQKQEEARRAREVEKQQLFKLLEEHDTKERSRIHKFWNQPNPEQRADLFYRLKCDLPTGSLVSEIWPELNLSSSLIKPAKA